MNKAEVTQTKNLERLGFPALQFALPLAAWKAFRQTRSSAPACPGLFYASRPSRGVELQKR